MIVNLVQEGWEIIYQQAHALLAAQIAFAWREADRPTRWVDTLAAIAQHDDGQRYWAGKHGLTTAGAPANFTMLPFSLDQAHQVMEEARFQGQWRSLLTSMHLSFLYEELRGKDRSTDNFLDEQIQSQANWRKFLKITKKEAQKAYDLMQWCDRLSLILCRRELPEAERALEISIGPDGSRYDVWQLNSGVIQVAPWPFEFHNFSVSIEASYLAQLQFASEEELTAALRQAPIHTKHWELSK
ncbi:DUF3891 family protein [Adhaeribacter pallidiroseus]|uniref:DUF3891 family protein n=1 Tax=Adhaeribacter pallidiroseus TaxID=2072847 RepID=A0A369QHD7_9BACT|nr:DUF3891 family protein [Adhaeribacter pallidiroseus]RDC64333.1 hypothetical protein AHMF7616_02946 [Adhaeribacter pallidiroseus]